MKRWLINMFAGAALLGCCAVWAAPGSGGPGTSGPKGSMQKQTRAEEQARMNHDKAKGKAERAETQVREREELEGEGLGPERKAEMQERQQERKEIQEEYKNAQRSGEGEKVKGKKPWWKFWGSDE